MGSTGYPSLQSCPEGVAASELAMWCIRLQGRRVYDPRQLLVPLNVSPHSYELSAAEVARRHSATQRPVEAAVRAPTSQSSLSHPHSSNGQSL